MQQTIPASIRELLKAASSDIQSMDARLLQLTGSPRECERGIVTRITHALTTEFPENLGESEDLSPQMRDVAQRMHDLAGALFDTQLPADIMRRLTALADDLQQVAGA